MPEIDIEEMREKARKATPGPWHHCQPFQVVPKQRTVHGSVPEQRVDYVSTWPGPGTPKGQRVVVPMPREDGPGVRSDDMAFIAAANPAAVLSLLDQLQAAERERDEARGKLASVAWIYNPLARARFCRFCQYREDRGHAPSCLLHPDVGPGELVTAGMIDRFLRAWYPGEWPDDTVFDRNRDEAGRAWRDRLVEETRAALTAALADPQAERVAELEKALDLILPLAKGYKPDEQTESAKRTCAEWIAVAEAALAAYRSTSRPAGPEDAGEFAAVGDYYIHQNGLWFASLDNPEDRDHVLTLLRSEQRPAEPAVEGERAPEKRCECFGDTGLQGSTHGDREGRGRRCDLCGMLVKEPAVEGEGEWWEASSRLGIRREDAITPGFGPFVAEFRNEADRDRAVSCVNACRNIKHPAGAVEKARDAIRCGIAVIEQNVPQDALGEGGDGHGQAWPLRDEWLASMREALAALKGE